MWRVGVAALICGAGLYLTLVPHPRTPGYDVRNLGVGIHAMYRACPARVRQESRGNHSVVCCRMTVF